MQAEAVNLAWLHPVKEIDWKLKGPWVDAWHALPGSFWDCSRRLKGLKRRTGGQTDAACHNIGRRGPSTRKGLRGAISQRSGCRRCECWIQFHLVKPSLQPETCRVYLREAGRWRKQWPDENLLKCVALLCCKEERNGKEKVESLVILPRISWQGQLRWKKILSFVKRSTAKLGSKLLHLSDAHSGRWHRAQLLQLFLARITGWYKKNQKKTVLQLTLSWQKLTTRCTKRNKKFTTQCTLAKQPHCSHLSRYA